MPCASTVCARLRIAAPCLRRSIIRACSPAAPMRRRVAGRRSTMTSCWPNWQGAAGASDITELRHVRTSADKRAAEEIANRTDVRGLRDVQAAVRAACSESLKSGIRQTLPVQNYGRNQAGRDSEGRVLHRRRPDRLCRRGGRGIQNASTTAATAACVSSTTTAPRATCCMRSFQRALHRDEAGRRITDPDAGPLFADEAG